MLLCHFFINIWASKAKVFYGKEPPSGDSTTTECGFNYKLLAVIYWSSQMGAPSCSLPQPATDHGARDGRSNWLVAPPPYAEQFPLSSTYCTVLCGLQITRLAALSEPRTCDLRNARPGIQSMYVCLAYILWVACAATESMKRNIGLFTHNFLL